jgi:hypothetical protein
MEGKAVDMRCTKFVAGIAYLALAIGCNEPQPAERSEAEGANRTAVVQGEGPGPAVQRFLEAVRAGNDKESTAMLTPVARQKTAEYDMVVAPASSDTASFRVGGI